MIPNVADANWTFNFKYPGLSASVLPVTDAVTLTTDMSAWNNYPLRMQGLSVQSVDLQYLKFDLPGNTTGFLDMLNFSAETRRMLLRECEHGPTPTSEEGCKFDLSGIFTFRQGRSGNTVLFIPAIPPRGLNAPQTPSVSP